MQETANLRSYEFTQGAIGPGWMKISTDWAWRRRSVIPLHCLLAHKFIFSRQGSITYSVHESDILRMPIGKLFTRLALAYDLRHTAIPTHGVLWTSLIM